MRGLLRTLHSLLTSPRLAIALLVAVLACCLVGVTVYRGEQAWALIFSTLWFNALLSLLAVSSGAAFFTRIWRRRLTLLQGGMILFHVSFIALLGGVVVDSLFHFKGLMRLTEGETLPNGDLRSYDVVEAGRFFDVRRLRGETTLVAVHPQYVIDGKDKRAAYELSVGEGAAKQTGILYVTKALEHDGVRYFRDREGYSILVVMAGKDGAEIYGAHVPLQSIRTAGESYLYATGTPTEAKSFPFPPPPDEPRLEILPSYRPSTVTPRAGDVSFSVVPLKGGKASGPERSGQVPVGAPFDAGEVTLTPREIRYWVGVLVRYDPALNVVFASLISGLVGVVMTFVARMRQERRRPQ